MKQYTQTTIEGITPRGRQFKIHRTWSDDARHVASTLEYCAWEGVGSVSIPIRYEGSGEVIYQLRTAGQVSEETRRAVFLT